MKSLCWKIVVVLIIAVVIALFFALTRPNFLALQPYAHSGGFVAFPQDKICDCVGIAYSYDLQCSDCGTDYYCIGTPINCKCLNNSQTYFGNKYYAC